MAPLGNSLLGDWPVEEKIAGRLPLTLELGLLAIVIGLVIGVPIGIVSAIRQDTTVDYVGRSVAIVGLATPNFWLGVMVMTYPSVWWGTCSVPSSENTRNPKRPACCKPTCRRRYRTLRVRRMSFMSSSRWSSSVGEGSNSGTRCR